MCKDKREAGSMRLRVHRVYKKMDRRRKIELFDRIAHKVSKGVYDSVLNERNAQLRVKATNIFFLNYRKMQVIRTLSKVLTTTLSNILVFFYIYPANYPLFPLYNLAL